MLIDGIQLTPTSVEPSNVVSRDSGGKASMDQMPSIVITDTYVVNSEVAMLALTAQVGDVAVRTDLNQSFILRLDGASTLSNWQELLSAAPFTLPTASNTVLGGVKVDGTSITISNGVISGASTYSLPTASTTVLGGIKVDGTSLTINGSGVVGVAALPTGISSSGLLVSTNAAVSAAGTTQANATAITSDRNIITTAAAGSGVVVPVAVAGKTMFVVNNGANAVKVYPAVGGYFDALAINLPITLPVGQTLELSGYNSTKWMSSYQMYVAGGLTLSSTAPANLAAAATVGVGTTAARADHVHQIPALTYTGDATGTRAAGASAVALTLANVVTAGTGYKVTYNAKGLVTASTTIAAADLPIATASTLGAIKVGTGLSIAAGVLSTTSGAAPYDISGGCFGQPGESEKVIRFVSARAFTIPINLTGLQAVAGTAATASSVFNITKNGTTVATVTFAAAGTTGTLSSQAAISFAIGDKFAVVAPSVQDVTLADVDFTVIATLV